MVAPIGDYGSMSDSNIILNKEHGFDSSRRRNVDCDDSEKDSERKRKKTRRSPHPSDNDDDHRNRRQSSRRQRNHHDIEDDYVASCNIPKRDLQGRSEKILSVNLEMSTDEILYGMTYEALKIITEYNKVITDRKMMISAMNEMLQSEEGEVASILDEMKYQMDIEKYKIMSNTLIGGQSNTDLSIEGDSMSMISHSHTAANTILSEENIVPTAAVSNLQPVIGRNPSFISLPPPNLNIPPPMIISNNKRITRPALNVPPGNIISFSIPPPIAFSSTSSSVFPINTSMPPPRIAITSPAPRLSSGSGNSSGCLPNLVNPPSFCPSMNSLTLLDRHGQPLPIPAAFAQSEQLTTQRGSGEVFSIPRRSISFSHMPIISEGNDEISENNKKDRRYEEFSEAFPSFCVSPFNTEM